MRILLIEDDTEAAASLTEGLRDGGHAVEHAADGTEGLNIALTGGFDAIVVDRMLPGMDGITIVETLRRRNNTTPVLFLSAMGQVDDRVTGLKAGGDDYLAKPFAFSELLARLEALVRRSDTAAPETRLKVGDLEMNLLTRVVTRGGAKIDLQPREFQILEYFMRHSGQVVTRTMLLENVWNYHFDPQTNVIDVHISRLRQKIDRDFDKPMLHTLRGSGYCLRAAD